MSSNRKLTFGRALPDPVSRAALNTNSYIRLTESAGRVQVTIDHQQQTHTVSVFRPSGIIFDSSFTLQGGVDPLQLFNIRAFLGQFRKVLTYRNQVSVQVARSIVR